MLGETERAAALEVFLHAVTAEDDGAEVRAHLAQSAEELEAAAVGKADVGDQDVGRPLAEERDSPPRALRRPARRSRLPTAAARETSPVSTSSSTTRIDVRRRAASAVLGPAAGRQDRPGARRRRELDRERGARPSPSLSAEIDAAVQLDEVAGDREAETESAGAPDGRDVTLLEGLEDAREVGPDAAARVRTDDADPTGRRVLGSQR